MKIAGHEFVQIEPEGGNALLVYGMLVKGDETSLLVGEHDYVEKPPIRLFKLITTPSGWRLIKVQPEE